MKKAKKDTCKFQSIVLKLVREKLNLMVSEVMQLKKCDINKCNLEDRQDKEELVKTILIKIAEGKVKSVHIHKDEAKEYLQAFNDMNIRQEVEPHFKSDGKKKTIEENSPFKESPFH